jgi:signal transduction histidine kinase
VKNRTTKWLFLAITIAAVTSSIIIVFYFDTFHIQKLREQIIRSKTNELQALVSTTQLRLNDAASILRITSQDESVITVQPSMIEGSVHGVPQNVDSAKRDIARHILNGYPTFSYVSFLLPNGDVYMVEPYSQQLSLSSTISSFRDYYGVALSTHDAYLSDRYVSTSLGTPSVAISYPIYERNNSSSSTSSSPSTLVGLWVGTLNIHLLDSSLMQLNAGDNNGTADGNDDSNNNNNSSDLSSRFIFVDKNGLKIAQSSNDTNNSQDSSVNESFAGYDFVARALSGESGWTIQTINGQNMFVAYHPIKALSNTWVALSIEPYKDTFATVEREYSQLEALVIVKSIIGLAIILFVLHSFRGLDKVSAELRRTNYNLQQREQELQSKNKELVRVEAAKDEFIAMMSHELKTPLVPIKGYAEMLTKSGLLGEVNEMQKKAIGSILKNTSALSILISDILDVYKLDMHKMRFSMTSVPVSDLVMQPIKDLQSLASEKGIELSADLKTSGNVFCDPGRINQVFSNLIKNSIDFVPASTGKITVKAEEEQGERDDYNNNSDKRDLGSVAVVVFSVEDNGQGIPADKADMLFQKFYQADTSATRKHGGTGLGLSICKGIVEAHGGKIWIDKYYRKGAAIRFTIPRSEEKGKRTDEEKEY